jgi:hypothetical protein
LYASRRALNETRAPHTDGTVWIENAHGDHWRCASTTSASYALEPDAHTPARSPDGSLRPLPRPDWCERLLDLADQWPDFIDHLPCDDATAEGIGDLLAR